MAASLITVGYFLKAPQMQFPSFETLATPLVFIKFKITRSCYNMSMNNSTIANWFFYDHVDATIAPTAAKDYNEPKE